MNSFISWIGGKRLLNMENAVEYITKISKRLNTVVIENVDFGRILKTYDRIGALFYLDPPYYGATLLIFH